MFTTCLSSCCILTLNFYKWGVEMQSILLLIMMWEWCMFFFDQINIILACATHNNKLIIQIQEDNLIICLVSEHPCWVLVSRNIIKWTQKVNIFSFISYHAYKPKNKHKNWWKHNWNPFYTTITTIKNYPKKKREKKLKIKPKVFHLLGGKFVNGDCFNLFLKHVCSFTFGDINITIFLRCDSNEIYIYICA
jgi:hypothetical protein